MPEQVAFAQARQLFAERGWLRFPIDPALSGWVAAARAAGRAAVSDPGFAQWHDCEGTWFVGVDALPNDAQGRVANTGPLSGAAMTFISQVYGPVPPLHAGQVSVTYPGYPRPRTGESESAFGYRLRRDAAHVDGVRAVGPARRRQVLEPHGFILGLPLTRADPDAAPLVVWEGSHRIMRRAFAAAFEGHDPAGWAELDVTEIYVAARRACFETCQRVPLPAQPGEAILLHRLALHGVAPWGASATAEPEGRMIAYFRPELPGGVADWIAPD